MRLLAIGLAAWLLAPGCNEPKPAPARAEEVKPMSKEISKADTAEKKQTKIEEAGFEPQVAGQFYTDSPDALRKQVSGFLDAARSAGKEADRDIVGILAPHAGYVYSGPVAGEAYRAVMGRGYKTVVVIALSHRKGSSAISVLNRTAYKTPLGSLAIDRESVRTLIDKHPTVFRAEEEMFKGEHSLEVQLPFIQVALPETKIVPIIAGVRDEELAARAGEALFDVFGNRDDMLFVVSSDLSHFYPYDEAKGYDTQTLSLLEKWKLDEWSEFAQSQKGMCGFLPMTAFARMFDKYEKSKRKATLLDYRNSQDTAGSGGSRGVVGYGAMAFSVEKGVRKGTGDKKDFGPFTAADRRALMELAKKAVAAAARGEKIEPEKMGSAILNDKGAAFVTLKKHGQLRGCIGHVVARMPLYQCIAEVAKSAAIYDTRFNQVTPEELGELTYEISVLTAPEPTTPDKVVVGRDGLIMSSGGRSGLLLPQVPVEWGWGKEEFLEHTCRKAGLPMGCWKDPNTEIKSFRAIVWGEEDLND